MNTPDATVSEREALITWSAISEPGDEAAGWLTECLGPIAALAWVRTCASDPVLATHQLLGRTDPRTADAAVAAAPRYTVRLADCDPAEHVERAARVGARAITRADEGWPPVLDVLGATRPYTLWVRGNGDVAALLERAVALVGARAATSYGEHVAAEIAGGAGDAGWCVVSGGAYGIDGAAHRAALTTRTPTIAMMAGGVDRLYPAGHTDLLSSVARTGAVISEVPVGFAPHRSRFLARNRVIAAAAATCVVEAAVRSGALNTARLALAAGRPVGAVPGPVTSMSSGGCHQLLRDGLAVLVRDWEDLLDIAGPLRPDAEPVAGEGFADPRHRRAFDAIAVRGSRADAVARGAGLTVGEAIGALGALEIAGLAVSKGGVWHRSSPKLSGEKLGQTRTNTVTMK